MEKRIAAILHALGELNRTVAERANAVLEEERIGVFLGEMDWRRELERLLYETV